MAPPPELVTVAVPERVLPVVLGETLKVKVPLLMPLVGLTVSQDELLLTDQLTLLVTVMIWEFALASGDQVVGLMVRPPVEGLV